MSTTLYVGIILFSFLNLRTSSGLLLYLIPICISEKPSFLSSVIFLIGDEKYLIDQEKLESWRILIDHPKLVQQMDQEHQRIYKDSQGIPSTKSKQNNIIEASMKQDAEKETWELIQDSNNIEDIEYFLNNFPNSSYALPAKLKLKQLKRN